MNKDNFWNFGNKLQVIGIIGTYGFGLTGTFGVITAPVRVWCFLASGLLLIWFIVSELKRSFNKRDAAEKALEEKIAALEAQNNTLKADIKSLKAAHKSRVEEHHRQSLQHGRNFVSLKKDFKKDFKETYKDTELYNELEIIPDFRGEY